MIHMETAMTQEQQKAVMCITNHRKVYVITHIVQDIDPTAFITISNIKEVKGRGFSFSRDAEFDEEY